MKKALCAFLSILLLTCICGCNNYNANNTSETTTNYEEYNVKIPTKQSPRYIYKNGEKIIYVGMSKKKIEEYMGAPDSINDDGNSEYLCSDGGKITTLFDEKDICDSIYVENTKEYKLYNDVTCGDNYSASADKFEYVSLNDDDYSIDYDSSDNLIKNPDGQCEDEKFFIWVDESKDSKETVSSFSISLSDESEDEINDNTDTNTYAPPEYDLAEVMTQVEEFVKKFKPNVKYSYNRDDWTCNISDGNYVIGTSVTVGDGTNARLTCIYNVNDDNTTILHYLNIGQQQWYDDGTCD